MEIKRILFYAYIQSRLIFVVSFPSVSTLHYKNRICTSNKPLLCPPHEAYCTYYEFCYAGLCESCFPTDMKENELLKWCQVYGQYNTSLMKSPTCRHACFEKFNRTELAEKTVDNVTEENVTAGRLCQEEKSWEPYKTIILSVFLGLMVLILIITVIVCCFAPPKYFDDLRKFTNDLKGRIQKLCCSRGCGNCNRESDSRDRSEAIPFLPDTGTNNVGQDEGGRTIPNEIQTGNVSPEASSSQAPIDIGSNIKLRSQ